MISAKCHEQILVCRPGLYLVLKKINDYYFKGNFMCHVLFYLMNLFIVQLQIKLFRDDLQKSRASKMNYKENMKFRTYMIKA